MNQGQNDNIFDLRIQEIENLTIEIEKLEKENEIMNKEMDELSLKIEKAEEIKSLVRKYDELNDDEKDELKQKMSDLGNEVNIGITIDFEKEFSEEILIGIVTLIKTELSDEYFEITDKCSEKLLEIDKLSFSQHELEGSLLANPRIAKDFNDVVIEGLEKQQEKHTNDLKDVDELMAILKADDKDVDEKINEILSKPRFKNIKEVEEFIENIESSTKITSADKDYENRVKAMELNVLVKNMGILETKSNKLNEFKEQYNMQIEEHIKENPYLKKEEVVVENQEIIEPEMEEQLTTQDLDQTEQEVEETLDQEEDLTPVEVKKVGFFSRIKSGFKSFGEKIMNRFFYEEEVEETLDQDQNQQVNDQDIDDQQMDQEEITNPLNSTEPVIDPLEEQRRMEEEKIRNTQLTQDQRDKIKTILQKATERKTQEIGKDIERDDFER